MPIIGVTTKGLSFPEIGRIRKGMMESMGGGKARPIDLDYFRVVFAEGEEESEKKFIDVYGPEPKEINIFLPFNEISEMFDGWMEAYTASRMLARSDGVNVVYRCDGKTGKAVVMKGKNLETGLSEIHPEDNVAGYDYKNNPVTYSPVGRLKIIVPELERAAYLMLTTGSWNDIRNISQQLRGLKELNNGVIKGVPLTLRRRDKEVMVPLKDKKQRMTKSLLSVEADPEWVAARIAEDKVKSFPQYIASTMLEPGADYPEEENESLSELTHPSEWETDEHTEGGIQPESSVEVPETAPAVDPEPVHNESGRPYSAEQVKKGILAGIAAYEKRLKLDPDKYAVQAEQDRKIIASIVNAHFAKAPDDSGPRYAVFKYLLGEGKGSSKNWTAYEIGTIKNLWLEVSMFGETLGAVQGQELMNVWKEAQVSQGQIKAF